MNLLMFKDYLIAPAGSKVKLVRLLYCKSNSYQSALVGIELGDHQGKCILQTKLMREHYLEPNTDY